MESLKIVSKQTFWQVLGKVVSALTGLFVLSLITRNYGAEGTGVFTLTLTYLTFFTVIADFGFNAHLMEDFISGGTDSLRKLLGLRLALAGSLTFLAILLSPLLPISDPNFKLSILIGALLIFLNGIFASPAGFFQAKTRFDLTVISGSIGTILATLLALFLIGIHAPIYTLISSEVLGWAICSILGILFLKRLVRSLYPVFDLDSSKRLFISAWPIALTLILNIVYFRVDSFIISSVKSTAEVGIYNLAYSFFQTALVIPTFIMNSYYPLMLQLLIESKVLFYRQLKKALLIMLGLSALGTLVSFVLSPILIPFVAGGGFEGSVSSLQILSLSFPAFFLSGVLMWVLVSLKRYQSMLLIYIAGLVVNIVLNIIFIPHYSYIASSWITGLSEYLILVLQIVILFKVTSNKF